MARRKSELHGRKWLTSPDVENLRFSLKEKSLMKETSK